MAKTSEAPLAVHEQAEKRRFEEEGEHSFHGECLADDTAGHFREPRPVGAELELHRYARSNADREVEAEDPDPEARGIIPLRSAGGEADRLEDHDEQRQPHRELWEEIVIDDGERKLEAMPQEWIGHV